MFHIKSDWLSDGVRLPKTDSLLEKAVKYCESA